VQPAENLRRAQLERLGSHAGVVQLFAAEPPHPAEAARVAEAEPHVGAEVELHVGVRQQGGVG
jgi:hypothetical protein